MLMFLSILNTEEEREFVSDLYEKNKQMMYHCAYRILNNREDAEDVVHDVFCIIADDLVDSLMNDSTIDLARFLFVCARNRAVNIAKRKSKLVSLDALEDAGFAPSADWEDDETINGIADRETAERAVAALLKMDKLYSDVIWMQLKGRSINEIANLFAEKRETVKKRLYRGKKLLRDAIGAEGGAA